MAVVTIGDTNLTFIVSDHLTPASGTYAFYCLTAQASLPLSPLVNLAIEAGVNVAEKFFDLTTVWRLSFSFLTSANHTNFLKMIDHWEANDTRLYLSIKNEWAVNMATRGTKAVPTTQGILRGKLFNLKFTVNANRCDGNVEFRYTSQ